MLKIRFTDNSLPPFWVMEKQFNIGTAKANQLSVNDDSVDNTHARIINRGDTFVLKDLGSTHGTYVNNTRITLKNIACGDIIHIGNISLEVIDPLLEEENTPKWALIADSSWLTGQEFQLNFTDKKSVTLGRANECDIVIPGTHLSRKHAEISLTDNGLQIRDLKSANGTFLNNKEITASRLRAGDQIRIDVYSFKVFGPGIALPRAATQTLKVITDDMLDNNVSEEKLWLTRATSPGNREQEDLYKKKWLPAAIALGILLAFCIGLAYVFVDF